MTVKRAPRQDDFLILKLATYSSGVAGSAWRHRLSDRACDDETLMPGEFIGSGTVGNGCGVELGWFLEHGDTIELDVEKIGVLKNKVERQDA